MVTNNNHHVIKDEEMSHHQYSYHSSLPKNNDDAITKILSVSESAGHNHDDDESTYYHSIMERRHHIKPNRDSKDDEEQSVATNLPQVPSSSVPPVMTSRRRNTTRRRARSSSNNNHRRPINPIILIVILGIAANWVANRLLNSLNESETVDDSYYMSRQHTIENNATKHSSSIANYNHAQASQSEGEQMIEKLSLNKLSKLSERYESNIHVETSISDGEKHQDDAEIQAKIERLQKGIAQMKQQLVSTNNNKVDATIYEPILQDVQKASSSPITERFVLLRKRLMSLYNEPVPNKEGRSNTTHHPLYNMDSPQFKALNWLANIDKSQITDDDPHVIQRFVLSVLYFSTGGPPVDVLTDFALKRRGGPWRNPTNFLSPNHECEWKSSVTKGEGRGGGIRRCDSSKNVVELSIYNELAGTIPSELGRLSFLRTLYLGRNNLIGTIPTELGMIRPLASISLQYNHLTGEIPQDYLRRIPTLRFLQLEGNPLKGKIEKDDPLCQMRNVYKPKNKVDTEHKRVLRVLTATCITTMKGSGPLGDMLECECCSKCFDKEKDVGL